MNVADQDGAANPRAVCATIDPAVFRALLNERARQMLRIATGAIPLRADQFELTRPLLGQLQAESSQLEELLDAYGARTNGQWYVFRARIAALKNFAQAGYELLHLEHASAGYNLIDGGAAFVAATRQAIGYVSALILCSLREWYRECQTLGLRFPTEGLHMESFTEVLPPGRLPRDRRRTYRETVKSRVVTLATQFLHGTERAGYLRSVANAKPEDFRSLMGDPVSEESLRGLEVRFHNLQSLYDTYVSDSDTEELDPELTTLRGHISAVLHLLRIGTIFVHFYERHIVLNRQALFCHDDCPYGEDRFFDVLMGYCLANSYRFLLDARRLCQSMLRRYAEIGSISVPVPRFHGFHVRPSTLVSLIARHYGSALTMECGGKQYNALETMELFRANEWINRCKREHICQDLRALPLDAIEKHAADRIEAIRDALVHAADRRIVSIHEHPLPIDASVTSLDAPFAEVLCTTAANLLRDRKINMESDISVAFTGDKRVLEDIRLLAENGYGEDDRGNNIPLPSALAYLRYSRSM